MSITSVNRHVINSGKRLDIAFVLSNVVGIAIYLTIASRGWVIPEEYGIIPISSEPFVWALALPVLGIFLLADIVWGCLLLRFKYPKKWFWWLIIGGAWLLAICIDFAHH